jgi:hypothetical protein
MKFFQICLVISFENYGINCYKFLKKNTKTLSNDNSENELKTNKMIEK